MTLNIKVKVIKILNTNISKSQYIDSDQTVIDHLLITQG